MPPAALYVAFQRRKRQQGGVRAVLRNFNHGLRQVLIPLHYVQVHGVAGRFCAVPLVGTVLVVTVQGHSAEHRVHIRQKAGQPLRFKPGTQRFDRAAGICRLPLGQLAARQQPVHGKLYIRRSLLLDLTHLRDKRKHTLGDVFALFKFAFGNGAVRQPHAVFFQHGLYRGAKRPIQKIVLFAPL